MRCLILKEYYFNTSDISSWVKTVKAGDRIFLSGTVFTARDAAHKRIVEALKNNADLPFDLNNAAIYYAGPTPTPDGLSIGSCGPTTSSRMDPYAPLLMENGLKCMIGKGERNKSVCDAIINNGSIYLCAIGGAGALAAKSIVSCEVIAYDDLGCESVKKLDFKDFPLIVAIDSDGGNLFDK
ncbi:MAG: fumarate hydratase C-terminal domain-containing protein [Clostridia bacterium]|nr:fumarate hydratase C-terminal domain-containing protein [Clostridia bacterium]